MRKATSLVRAPAHVNPRLAAIGLDAMLFGLISNWLANPGYLPLERHAEALIDGYLDGLKGQRPGRRKSKGGRRKVKVGRRK